MRVFKYVFDPLGSEQAYSHLVHLFDFSPLCVFWCVLKLTAPEDAKSHWLHCGFSSNWLPENMHDHIGYICLTCLHCVFYNESSNRISQENTESHWFHVWFFSTVCFQTSPQITCLIWSIITLVAFVRCPVIIEVIFAMTILCIVVFAASAWLSQQEKLNKKHVKTFSLNLKHL